VAQKTDHWPVCVKKTTYLKGGTAMQHHIQGVVRSALMTSTNLLQRLMPGDQ